MGEKSRIRVETADDRAAIRAVVTDAFGQADEAELVDRLRAEGLVTHSLVAARNGDIVGHILLSRIAILNGDGGQFEALSLAPVAVLTRLHGQGIGSALIREALARAKRDGHRVVLVLGEPAYYGRFGFSSALCAEISTPWPEAGDAFQGLELEAGALAGLQGARVEYSAPFLGL